MGSCPITFLWLWPATDHEPHCRHLPINKIWRRTESTPQSGWSCSHMAWIYSDFSRHERNKYWLALLFMALFIWRSLTVLLKVIVAFWCQNVCICVCMLFIYSTSEHFVLISGIETGGSGGLMNRGPLAPKGPELGHKKNFRQENNMPTSEKPTANYKVR